MKTMTIETFHDLMKDLPMQRKTIALHTDMRNGLEHNHGMLTYLMAQACLSAAAKWDEFGDPSVRGFVIDKELDIFEMERPKNHGDLREKLHAEEKTRELEAYLVMIASKQIQGDEADISEEEVRKLLDSDKTDEEKFALMEERGCTVQCGITGILSTRHGLNTVCIVSEEKIHVLGISDWEGDSPVVLETSGAGDLKAFVGLLKSTEALPRSEWAHCVGEKTPEEAKKTVIEKIDSLMQKDSGEVIAELMEADGHNAFQAAYTALAQLARENDLSAVDEGARRALIAVFQNRINLIEMSLEEDKVATHKAPETVQ
jgi:hypothetical protein